MNCSRFKGMEVFYLSEEFTYFNMLYFLFEHVEQLQCGRFFTYCFHRKMTISWDDGNVHLHFPSFDVVLQVST